jgi:AmmeMemoRadiSam system protein B
MNESNIRKPAVAGQFYASMSDRLRNDIDRIIDKKANPKEVIACITPHAGYMYSGRVAAVTISNVKIRNKIIILGPNHTGYGKPFGIMAEGIWEEPLGDVEIDAGLAQEMLKHSKYLKEDAISHIYEHSLEVQLPFFQYFSTDFKIVPITVSISDLEVYKKIGKEIAGVIKKLKLEDSVLIVASTDMTHYEPQDSAEKKDKQAIQAILQLDEEQLMKNIYKSRISMCGYGPTAIALVAAKELGAKSAQLIKYQTSGDTSGDYTSVVGYAGIIIY